MHALPATGVNAHGRWKILGVQVSSAEDGAGWLGFFRDLCACGLVDAIGATLPGASRRRT